MPTMRKSALAAAVVLAVAGSAIPAGAFAAPATVGIAAEDGLGAEFPDGVVAKVTGGTVIPVTVTGGTVGATLKLFTAAKVTAKVGGLPAPVSWVDATHVKVTAPATTKATIATMQLFLGGVPGPESTAKVAYPPSVTGVAPARISTAGGTVVTINGAGFLGVDAAEPGSVTFGDTPATSFTVVSAARITAVAPPGSAGPVPVTVRTAGGASPAVLGSSTTYRTALGIDSTAGLVAKASGGPLVLTVTGGTLGATAKEFAAERVSVTMGKAVLSATWVDATRLKVAVPATAADSAQIAVVHDTITGEAATLTLAPVVNSMSPRTDTIGGGARITIRIAAAEAAAATGFKFGDAPATCAKQGAGTTLAFVCTAPPVAEAGPVAVSFTSGTGKASRFTAAATFSYTD